MSMSSHPQLPRTERLDIKIDAEVAAKLLELVGEANQLPSERGALVNSLLRNVLIDRRGKAIVVRCNEPDPVMLTEIQRECTALHRLWNQIRAYSALKTTRHDTEDYRIWKKHDADVRTLVQSTKNLIEQISDSCLLSRRLDYQRLAALVVLFRRLGHDAETDQTAANAVAALEYLIPELMRFARAPKAPGQQSNGGAS